MVRSRSSEVKGMAENRFFLSFFDRHRTSQSTDLTCFKGHKQGTVFDSTVNQMNPRT